MNVNSINFVTDRALLLNLNHFNLQSLTNALVYQFFPPPDARLG